MITFGNQQTIALATQPASGAQYRSGDVDFWEHHGEATVTWSRVTYACKAR